jgi:N-acetylglucosaminyl-diphospho-decaprenol L-rhamnosyltransferase
MENGDGRGRSHRAVSEDSSSIGIVIVNYRTPELVIACLGTLAGEVESMPGTRVIITDNASGDDSIARIESAIAQHGWSDWARMMPLPHNGGFSYGNNRGIERLPDCRYILLLNSDTTVNPGVLRHCHDVMEAHPHAGAMSCLLLNPDGSVQNAARKFPTPIRMAACSVGLPWLMPRLFSWADLEDATWDRRTASRDVDWLGGAFLFIRREAIDQVGLLDEDFFFYGEDIEFCHRLARAGWKRRYDPGSSIVHIGGSSSDPTRLAARRRSVFLWQARYLLQRKCYGELAGVALRFVDIAAHLLRYLKLRLCGPRRREERDALRAVLSMLIRPLGHQTTIAERR